MKKFLKIVPAMILCFIVAFGLVGCKKETNLVDGKTFYYKSAEIVLDTMTDAEFADLCDLIGDFEGTTREEYKTYIEENYVLAPYAVKFENGKVYILDEQENKIDGQELYYTQNGNEAFGYAEEARINQTGKFVVLNSKEIVSGEYLKSYKATINYKYSTSK